MVEGLGGEDGRYTDGLQPRSGSHSKFGDGIIELVSQWLEVSRVGCDEVEFLNVMERKFRNMFRILCASESDGNLHEIRRVEEGDMLERDIVRVPVQCAEVGEEDVAGSKVAEGRPGREREIGWPGPLDLEVAHNSSIPINAGPFLRLWSTFEVLNGST